MSRSLNYEKSYENVSKIFIFNFWVKTISVSRFRYRELKFYFQNLINFNNLYVIDVTYEGIQMFWILMFSVLLPVYHVLYPVFFILYSDSLFYVLYPVYYVLYLVFCILYPDSLFYVLYPVCYILYSARQGFEKFLLRFYFLSNFSRKKNLLKISSRIHSERAPHRIKTNRKSKYLNF